MSNYKGRKIWPQQNLRILNQNIWFDSDSDISLIQIWFESNTKCNYRKKYKIIDFSTIVSFFCHAISFTSVHDFDIQVLVWMLGLLSTLLATFLLDCSLWWQDGEKKHSRWTLVSCLLFWCNITSHSTSNKNPSSTSDGLYHRRWKLRRNSSLFLLF